MGTNAIVGGAVPFASGFAWADKHAETDNVSVTYFGDGATNIGSVLETANPRRGVEASGVLLHREQPVRRLDHRAGGDRRPAAVGSRARVRHPQLAGRRHGHRRRVLAMQQALEHMRGGSGPTADRGRHLPVLPPERPSRAAFGYRSKDEEQSYRDRDPILKVEGT